LRELEFACDNFYLVSDVLPFNSLLQMHAFLIELVENFVFTLPPGGIDIQRVPALLMIPMVRGKMHEGTQMPLCVSLVDE
jgi:hypothetical protein